MTPHIAITAAHWAYLAGVVAIVATMILRTNVVVPSIIATFLVSLVWSHPEFHPVLWSNALGAPMPAPEGDVTLVERAEIFCGHVFSPRSPRVRPLPRFGNPATFTLCL